MVFAGNVRFLGKIISYRKALIALILVAATLVLPVLGPTLVKAASDGLSVHLSVTPSTADQAETVTFSWWVEGVYSEHLVEVDFQLRDPVNKKIIEEAYGWDGVGSESSPVVRIWDVPSDASPGTYLCVVEAHSGLGKPFSYHGISWVDFSVTEVTPPEVDTTPPEVEITYSPENPTTEDEVTFTATASDESGIDWILIWVKDERVAECFSSPCIYTGGPYPQGGVNYATKAWDKADNSATAGDFFVVEPAVGEPEVDTMPPEVSISPASQEVRPGDSFTVDIYVDPAAKGVSSVSVAMLYDTAAMQLDGVELGDLLGESPILAEGFPKIDNVTGTLQVDAERSGTTPVPTSPGVFVSAELTIKTEASPGTYDLNLEVRLDDENELSIPGVIMEDGTVTITIAGAEYPRWDINEDGEVGIKDLAILGAHYGESTVPPYPRYDINEDGTVDFQDLAVLAAHYGEGAA